jgi:hypothetical protein
MDGRGELAIATRTVEIAGPVHRGERTQEVALVFGSPGTRFEQENHLRDHIGDALGGTEDQLVVGQGDRGVAAAHPSIAQVRLAEHVQAIQSGRRFAQPCPMPTVRFLGKRPYTSVADKRPFEARERVQNFAEPLTRDADLEIGVRTSETADKQVQRPPGCDIAGQIRRCSCRVRRAASVVRPRHSTV